MSLPPPSQPGPSADLLGLTELLRAWLPEQRWFAGKGADVGAVAVDVLDRAADPEVWHLVLTVDGARYQVPVVVHDEPVERLAHVAVGELTDGRWAYDALHDRAAAAVLINRFVDPAGSRLDFHTEPGAVVPVEEVGFVLTAEQSNTSIAYGDQAMLKVFRRLQAGTNPDIEIHDVLTRAGCEDIAPMIGWISHGDTSLAMLQEFLPTATDGWALAAASVRDLYAEGDLHADEVGGDFAAESHRLGATMAGVHRALHAALPSTVLDADGTTALATRLQERVRDGIAAVPELAPSAQALLDAVGAVAGVDVEVQRVHGDMHLGQALRTVTGWRIVDFEGEPSAPVAERVAPDSPIRDVAGIMRSLDYAASHLWLSEHGDSDQIAYRAAEWVARNTDALCRGYAEVAGFDPREHEVLLRAYEIDKCVYEAVYEARNRPTWLAIPLTAIERLVR